MLPSTSDEVVTATTEPEVPTSAPNFPEDTETMMPQEVAQKLGAEANDVQDTLKDLGKCHGQTRDELIVRLSSQTEARVTELCNIRVSDVDRDARSVNIRSKGRRTGRSTISLLSPS